MIDYVRRVSPIEVDVYIKIMREENGGFITPEIANKVLEMTNNYANIKFVVKEINRLDEKKRLEFKDFVLNAVWGRKHSKDAYKGLEKLAIDGGYEDEFYYIDEAYYKDYDKFGLKVFFANENRYLVRKMHIYDKLVFDEEVQKIVVRNPRFCFDGVYLPRICDFSLVNDLVVECNTNSSFEELKFKEGGSVDLTLLTNAPRRLEFNKGKVTLQDTDLTIVDELIFNECEEVNFIKDKLPDNLDVSKVKKLSFVNIEGKLDNLNLSNCKSIHIEICLDGIVDGFDFSSCDLVVFSKMGLDNFNSFKFRDGSSIVLDCCADIPSNLDLTPFSNIHIISNAELIKGNIKFRDGACVKCERTKFSKNVDFSMCDKVVCANNNEIVSGRRIVNKLGYGR